MKYPAWQFYPNLLPCTPYSHFSLLAPLFISYLEPKILCYSERNFPKELQRFLEMMDPSKKIPLLTWLCTKHHLFPPNRFFF